VLRRRFAYHRVVLALTAVVTACGGPGPVAGDALAPSNAPAGASSSAAPGTTTPNATTTTTAPPPSSSTPKAPTPNGKPAPAGTVVVLDPGHNGGNGAHPEIINKLVPAGRGQTKPCNTTGTSTNAGYTEHAFTWDVAQRVRDLLTARGVQVVMTRQNDTGVGPCVNDRAAVGNRANATAVVSIHADGSTGAGDRGFHVAYSSPPLNAAQGDPSMKLARTLRDGLVAAGFPTSNYVGSNGLSARNDLAGLNLSERPVALIECGNMRNADEAATLSSAAGRARYAAAIADAIVAYLNG
jgi:N-acetylmuramoyl-L-alanine amidase